SSDSPGRRSLCPVRSSVLSSAPPTAPPRTPATLSSTARCVPDGSAAVVSATWPVLAPAHRDNNVAQGLQHIMAFFRKYRPSPQPAAFHARGGSPAGLDVFHFGELRVTRRSSGSARAVHLPA